MLGVSHYTHTFYTFSITTFCLVWNCTEGRQWINVWVADFSFSFWLIQVTCVAALHTFTAIPVINWEREREGRRECEKGEGGEMWHLVRLGKAHGWWVIGRQIWSFLGWQIVWPFREYCWKITLHMGCINFLLLHYSKILLSDSKDRVARATGKSRIKVYVA